jgi:predicted dehydrogenase
MNRREFMRVSATGAVTFQARSYARILGANDRVGLGIAGLGRRGTIVGDAFFEDNRTRLVAVNDVYDVQASHFLSRLGSKEKPAQGIAWHDLLAQKDVDAVLIATPDHLHVNMAVEALAAGKHLYLEKPTLHHWDDRSRLLEAAGKSRVVLQCGTQQRSSTHYLRAKQEIFDQGKLGKLLLARAVWHNFPWQQRYVKPEPKPANLNWDLFLGPAERVPYETVRYSSWRYFPDYGNGLLADILTHWVDVAQWMLNDAQPQAASALGGIYKLHDQRQNPDTVSAVIQYNGWNLNFESSVCSIRDDKPSVFFEGTEGTLDLSRDGYTFSPNRGEASTVLVSESLERAHTRNFLDAVLGTKAVTAPLNAGIDASLPVQMALRSYWQHKIVMGSDLS